VPARIDFAGLAARLLSEARALLPAWLPAGKFRGHEFLVGNLSGDPGESLSINADTGRWSDFAGDAKGGDLVSLYAAIHRISQSEAAFELAPDDAAPRANGHAPAVAAPKPVAIRPGPAPTDHPPPPPIRSWGDVRGTWPYYGLEPDTGPLFIVCRYDPPDGSRKQFIPYTWRGGKWERKSYPQPRPLYRLRELAARPDDPVLIVEGEKAADAAIPYLPGYVVTTWPGGAAAVKTADYTPLKGRHVTIWPDADEPGSEAAATLAGILLRLEAHICVLRIPPGLKPEGWDVADAIDEDVSTQDLERFIATHTVRVEPPKPATPPELPPDDGPAQGGSKFVNWQSLQLDTNHNGQPHQNLSNAIRVVKHHPDVRGKIWLDTFRGRVYHTTRGAPKEWADADDLSLTAWIQSTVGLHKIGVQTVSQAVTAAATSIGRNSLTTWLNSLEWDGIGRIECWLSDFLGVAHTSYSAAVGRNWLLSMVARAYVPGCKADHMPVIEGLTGRGKSSAIAILGGEWYAEIPDAFGGKEFEQNIQGTWLIEIPDLAGFSKREHGKIIAFISKKSDRYRASYGRRPEEHPRTCIFAGTSEDDDYLQSSVGIRRFWPIRAGVTETINLEGLAEARAQLFAEATQLYRAGATWHEGPDLETRAEQAERREEDPWLERVAFWCQRKREVTASEVLNECLNVDVARQTQIEKRRASAILRAMGWIPVLVRRGAAVSRVWKNPLRTANSDAS
jgi:putative DNA primase/helicase